MALTQLMGGKAAAAALPHIPAVRWGSLLLMRRPQSLKRTSSSDSGKGLLVSQDSSPGGSPFPGSTSSTGGMCGRAQIRVDINVLFSPANVSSVPTCFVSSQDISSNFSHQKCSRSISLNGFLCARGPVYFRVSRVSRQMLSRVCKRIGKFRNQVCEGATSRHQAIWSK